MSDKEENPPRTELPLIVNTPGWVKGKLTSCLVINLNFFNPAFIFLLHTKKLLS